MGTSLENAPHWNLIFRLQRLMFYWAFVDTVFGGLGLIFCSQCLGQDPEAQRAEEWVLT